MKNKMRQEKIQVSLTEAKLVGKQWEVIIIAAGESKNPSFYPEETLKTAIPMFEKADINIYSQFNHLNDKESKALESNGITFFANLVGYVENVRWDEATKSIKANLHIFDAYKDVQSVLKESFENGKPLGLSVDIRAFGYQRESNGREEYYITEISSVESVDIVTNPAAGGAFERIIANVQTKGINMDNFADYKCYITNNKLFDITESVTDTDGLNELVLRKIATGDNENEVSILESISDGIKSNDFKSTMNSLIDLKNHYNPKDDTSETEPIKENINDADKIVTDNTDALKDLEKRILEMTNASLYAVTKAQGDALIKSSGLPKVVIIQALKEADITKPDINGYKKIIEEKKIFLDELTKSGVIDMPTVRVTRTHQDVLEGMAQAFFESEDVKLENGDIVESFSSIHQLYKEMSGNWRATPSEIGRSIIGGFKNNPDFHAEGTTARTLLEARRHSESASSAQWNYILANVMTKTLLKSYAQDSYLNDAMKISTLVPAKDFQTMYPTKMGGYSSILSSVAEMGTYAALTSPANVRASGSVKKYGGYDQFTMEMIVNDDVGAFRRIPVELARVAAWTVYYKTMSLISGNETYTPDGTKVFASGHGNALASGTAFSAATLASVQIKMGAQKSYGHADYLGRLNRIKYLIVPPVYEQLAWELCNSNMRIDSSFDNTTPNFYKRPGMTMEPIIMDYAGTSSTYWFVMADPKVLPAIQLSFLGGKKTPEIFIQDGELSDIAMTSDAVKFKIRQIFAGIVIDYRPLAGVYTT